MRIDAPESCGARGYPSLSMSAVVDEYERRRRKHCGHLWHRDPKTIADWMAPLRQTARKPPEVWQALGDRLAASDQEKEQEWYMRIQNRKTTR